jgi:hypothetical protein
LLAVLLVINYLVRASRSAKPIASENPDHV